MLRSIDIARRMNLQNMNFQFLRCEESFRANIACMIPRIIVSSFDVRCEFVTKIEFFSTETSQHLHVHFVLGFHVIFQAFVPRERRLTHCAVNLLSELFRNVFSHVRSKIAFEKCSKAAQITEKPFDLVVNFVNVSLKLIFVIRIPTQPAKSSERRKNKNLFQWFS